MRDLFQNIPNILGTDACFRPLCYTLRFLAYKKIPKKKHLHYQPKYAILVEMERESNAKLEHLFLEMECDHLQCLNILLPLIEIYLDLGLIYA